MPIVNAMDRPREAGLVHGWSDNLAMYTSARTEWVWLLGRMAIIGVVLLTVVTMEMGAQASQALLMAAGFVVAYSAALAVLLLREQLLPVFMLGVVLDTTTLLAAWWSFAQDFRGASLTNDLYLVVLPLVAVNAIRFPIRLTIAYLALLMAWMAWISVSLYSGTGYDVVQLPVRMALISITILLFAYFIHERRKETAERCAAEDRLDALQAQFARGKRAFEREKQEVVRSANRSLEARLAGISDVLRANAQQARTVLATSPSATDVRLSFAYFINVVERTVSAYPQARTQGPVPSNPADDYSGTNCP